MLLQKNCFVLKMSMICKYIKLQCTEKSNERLNFLFMNFTADTETVYFDIFTSLTVDLTHLLVTFLVFLLDLNTTVTVQCLV